MRRPSPSCCWASPGTCPSERACSHGDRGLRQAADVRLIDQRFALVMGRGAVVAPVKTRIGDDAFRHGERTVAVVEREIRCRAADPIAHERVGPFQLPSDLAGIGIDEQFVGIEAMPTLRVIGAVNAQAIARAGSQPLDMTMPDVAVAFRQGKPRQFASAIVREQADVDSFSMGRKHREVDSGAIEGRPQRPGATSRDRAVGKSVRRGCDAPHRHEERPL